MAQERAKMPVINIKVERLKRLVPGVKMNKVLNAMPFVALDIEGIRTVLALRSQYGQPHKELADPAKYYDLSYYDRAQPQ